MYPTGKPLSSNDFEKHTESHISIGLNYNKFNEYNIFFPTHSTKA